MNVTEWMFRHFRARTTDDDATGDRARGARDGERDDDDDDDERAVALDRGAVPDDDERDAREGEGYSERERCARRARVTRRDATRGRSRERKTREAVIRRALRD